MSEWKASSPVPVVVAPARAVLPIDTPTLQKVKSALEAIPNDKEDDLSYENWRDLLFAIHDATAGSAEGLQLALDFSARSSKHDADFLENRVWNYIKHRPGDGITARTLFHRAHQHNWSEPVDDLFAVLGPDSADPVPAGRRFRVVQAAEFAARQNPDWIIRDVLPVAELAVVFGESGSGKSFLALDIALAIARGREWRGFPVLQSPVVYVAAEGTGGFAKRLRAAGHQFNLGLSDIAFGVVPDAPNLMLLNDTNDLIASILDFGRPGAVFIDTWAQTTPGANENAGEDMGKALGHCKRIHKATGALVVLIHHSGKDQSRGARGWSGLNAASDCTIEVTRNENDRCATIVKMKDGEDGAQFGFKLLTVPLDENTSSCVVEHTVATPKSRATREGTGTIQKLVQAAIRDSLDSDNLADPIDVYKLAIEGQALDPEVEPGSKKDRRRDKVRRALDALIEDGSMVIDGGKYRLQ